MIVQVTASIILHALSLYYTFSDNFTLKLVVIHSKLKYELYMVHANFFPYQI